MLQENFCDSVIQVSLKMLNIAHSILDVLKPGLSAVTDMAGHAASRSWPSSKLCPSSFKFVTVTQFKGYFYYLGSTRQNSGDVAQTAIQFNVIFPERLLEHQENSEFRA